MTQINCQTPKDRWEDLYCWGDLGLSAAAAVAEAARTRFFWEWKAIRHPALVPVPPPWGTTIPIPEGWTPANAVTRADPFYPQAFSRFAVKYFVQSAGVAAGLLNAVKTGDRLVSGDSEEEGTLVRDGLFFGASLTGLFAFSSPSRLERYDWGRFSASLSTAAMTVYAASDFKKLSQAPLNSPEWKMVATQASLAGLNYVAGRGLQPGQGKKLSKDRVTWRRMRREVNEGRYGVDDVVKVGETSPPEIWVRNEFGSFGMKRMPPNGTIEVRNTLFNIYDRVNGEVVKVGFMEMHWPYRGGERFGPPEVTIQIGEQFRDNGILARARYTAMQKYPDYFPPTWQTQTSWPGFTPTEAYDRTLLGTGTRVSASVSVFRQKQNVPDGETYFYNRPVKTIRPDHRWVSPEEMGPMSWSARQWRRAVSGPVKNFRDSVSDYYDLFDFVRQTPEVYLGLVGHPQGTPLMRFRHRMADRLQARGQSSLAGRVGGVTYRERPATRTPVAMDNVPWWNNQWRPFGGRPPFEAGDTRRLPTAQFHRRFWGREYW